MRHNIPDYDWNYAHQEWGRKLSFYQKKLRENEFDKVDGLVLDAGCGTGQWVDALASLGKETVGVDIRKYRLEIASIFLDKERTHLIQASVEYLPFRHGVFDSEICYGVIMFVDEEQTLSELFRVMNSGKLLICCNSLGWSLRLLFRKPKDAIKTILNTWFHKKGTKYISKSKLLELLSRVGFLTYSCRNGKVWCNNVVKSSVYNSRFVLETVVVKI